MLDVDSGIGEDEAIYDDPKMYEKQLVTAFRYVRNTFEHFYRDVLF